jgi:hypothetical protein
MSTTTKNSKLAELSLLRQMAAGLAKHFAGKSLVMGGTTIKADDIVANIDAIETEVAAADAARTTWSQLLEVANKSRSGFAPTLTDLRRYLQGTFGVGSKTLLDFGLTPQKPPATTAQTTATAVTKRAATREARHTMGKKQKAAIHGSVAPAPSASPLAAAPSTTGGKPTS